jgi:Flp pilus assembly protein TadD
MADAEKGFLALTKSNPDLGGPHANLGIVYRQTGRNELAVAQLELAIKCNPQQPVFWNQLGIAYRQQGQFAKARDAYEHATAIDPGYPAPILNLGILFDLYLWDGKRALELYDRYLALTPGGDAKVSKWVADLKNRNREGKSENRKEKE